MLPDPSPLADPSAPGPEGAAAPLLPEPAPGTAETTARPRRRRVLLALLALVLAGLVFEALTWPDVAALAENDPATTAFIERWKKRQERAGKSAEPRWRPVSYARIASHLKRAVLVSEDIEFFSHQGFSRHEMRQAFRDAWEERRLPRGASTLTQQLAKNLWLSPSRNPLRKVKEALLTVQLERELSKRRILELYLNVVEFGPGIYGADAAARHYYGVSAANLSETQAAGLAAGLPKPSSWHPGSSSRTYQKRVRSILRRMAKARFLRREI